MPGVFSATRRFLTTLSSTRPRPVSSHAARARASVFVEHARADRGDDPRPGPPAAARRTPAAPTVAACTASSTVAKAPRRVGRQASRRGRRRRRPAADRRRSCGRSPRRPARRGWSCSFLVLRLARHAQVSTIAMITASTGRLSVTRVWRAELPEATRTISSGPAPTASAATRNAPVSRPSSSTPRTSRSLSPSRLVSFWLATTVPTTLASCMGVPLRAAPPGRREGRPERAATSC